MASIGPKNGGTFASDNTVGTIAITNPSNATSSDDSRATAILLLNEVTNYLKVTNFSLNIPIHSKIDGIMVEVERNSTVVNSITDSTIRLVLPSGSFGATNKSAGATWPNADAYATFGSSSDLWSETLTPIDVNDRNFGVAISCTATLLAGTAQIDHVRITVTYTPHPMPHNFIRAVQVGGGTSRNEQAS